MFRNRYCSGLPCGSTGFLFIITLEASMNGLKDSTDLNNTPIDVSAAAEKYGIPNPVFITGTLKEALSPNDFLTNLGVQYSERLDNIMGFLKGMLVPVNGGPGEGVPEDGTSFPFVLLKGPYVREVPVSIRVERKTDGGGRQEILLSIVRDEE
jgi:hypothetical protein